MNETDNPRSERRRSSRGRRRRGGGDRTKEQPQGASAPVQQKNQQPSSQNGAQRQKQNQNQRTNERQQSRGKEKNGRGGDQSRGDRNERGQRQRRSEQPEGRQGGQQQTRDRSNAPRIVPPTLPKPLCPRCGAPIEDLPSALNDKETGAPIHFDCVLARIAEGETLADGEKVVYLGGGRFGVVLFENPGDLKRFRVRKTIQWEEKDKRADWRREVTDLYSAT